MVTDRCLDINDLSLLAISLGKDSEHQGTDPEFFTQGGTVCKVYEDEHGPICFVRGTKALRLDIHYVDNNDVKRNMTAMLSGFNAVAQKAKANGFTEVVFQSNNEMLKRFCIRRFGFIASDGELRKVL